MTSLTSDFCIFSRRPALVGLCVLSTTANAEVKFEQIHLSVPVRGDVVGTHTNGTVSKGRLQYQTSVRYNIGLANGSDTGNWNLLGLLGSGESFTSQWNTAVDFREPGPHAHPFLMRQVYLQHELNRWRTQVGVIPPVKGFVSNTSLDKDGWIRGGRLVVPVAKQGAFEVVAGGLHGIDEPGFVQAWAPINYGETEWTHHWSESFRSELGSTTLNEAWYVRTEARYTAGGEQRPVTFGFELMHKLQTSAWAYDGSIEARTNRIRARFEYSYVADDFGLLGELSNDFFALGHLGMLACKGPFGDNEKLTWFAKAYLGETEFRANAGIVASLKM